MKSLFIEPGSPWENGYIESFNSRLRGELLSREVFDALKEAQVLIERWRNECNHVRPHSYLGCVFELCIWAVYLGCVFELCI